MPRGFLPVIIGVIVSSIRVKNLTAALGSVDGVGFKGKKVILVVCYFES